MQPVFPDTFADCWYEILQARCLSCHPAKNVKTLTENRQRRHHYHHRHIKTTAKNMLSEQQKSQRAERSRFDAVVTTTILFDWTAVRPPFDSLSKVIKVRDVTCEQQLRWHI